VLALEQWLSQSEPALEQPVDRTELALALEQPVDGTEPVENRWSAREANHSE